MTHQSLSPAIATDQSLKSAKRAMSPVNIFSENPLGVGRGGTPPEETLFKTFSPMLAQLKSGKEFGIDQGEKNIFKD